ncbi:leucine-rich_repeat domain-containing protein [Hexamita inflata]|uniref:Leucine-rich repeat domain-containing protein n=1 Tax=Hexamita inflata TaxID=28002 RepID=A0AA86NX52_9EUKA|nr:leucine-rich repeat domain-containing protein [Hexamita inflata]
MREMQMREQMMKQMMKVKEQQKHLYTTENAKQLQYYQKFVYKTVGHELSINNENNIQSLKFIKQLEIKKLTLNQCEQVNFNDIPDQLQELQVIGDCKLNGIENSNIQSLICKYDMGQTYFHQQENALQRKTEYNFIPNLNNMKYLEYLQLSGFNQINFEDFANIKPLKHLDLSGNGQIFKSEFINLQSLTHLDMSRSNISNIESLNQIKSLQNVNLSNNKIVDISALQDLGNISHLNLSGNQITKPVFCENCSLIFLDLSYNERIDTTQLSNLVFVEQLFLVNTNIQDISFLTQLNNIKVLDISLNNINSLNSLSKMKQLTTLLASVNQIDSIADLHACQQLQTLLINQNKISDISVIQHMQMLEEVDVSNNSITDISHIQNLPNLLVFNGDNNVIKDISFLEQCQNLSELRLSHNLINNFNKINSTLSILVLEDNQIINIDNFLPQAKQLRTLSLINNYIFNERAYKEYKQSIGLQRVIDISYFKRNISQELSDEECVKLQQLFLGNLQEYLKNAHQKYDEYFSQKYCNSLRQSYVEHLDRIDRINFMNPFNDLEFSDERPDPEITQGLEIQNNQYLHNFQFVNEFNTCKILRITFSYNVCFERTPINIVHLCISSCKLKSIEGIQQMKQLQGLDLSRNKLVDISPLRLLSDLKSIDISSNQVVFVDSLKYLKCTNLDLYCNNIVKQQFQAINYSNSRIDRRFNILNQLDNIDDQIDNQEQTNFEIFIRITKQRPLNQQQQQYYNRVMAIRHAEEQFHQIMISQARKKPFEEMQPKFNSALVRNVHQLSHIAGKLAKFIIQETLFE